MENDYLLQPISVKLTDRLPKICSPRPPPASLGFPRCFILPGLFAR